MLVAGLVSRGAAYAVVPESAVPAWKDKTAAVTRSFEAAHPDVMRKFRAVAGF